MSSQVRKNNRSRSSNHVRKLAFSAMFAALALIFSYVEVLIPVPVPIPGVKLGIANLVILIAIYRLGFRYAFTINCVRIVASGLLFSGVFGMIYSFAGGILSIIIMYLLYRTKLFSMVGVSMAGGVAHNLGQLATACLIVSNIKLMSYFAVLLFSGLISGILIGILAYHIEKRLPKDIN
ncbi:MAG: Gx transporter family protein [Firmicutes bacterium]|nr:Gx transporter family protein [Bacillota bacterium]